MLPEWRNLTVKTRNYIFSEKEQIIYINTPDGRVCNGNYFFSTLLRHLSGVDLINFDLEPYSIFVSMLKQNPALLKYYLYHLECSEDYKCFKSVFLFQCTIPSKEVIITLPILEDNRDVYNSSEPGFLDLYAPKVRFLTSMIYATFYTYESRGKANHLKSYNKMMKEPLIEFIKYVDTIERTKNK